MTPFDRMDPEAFPRPALFDTNEWNLRQTYISYYNPSTPTNKATHALWNGSTGNTLLVLRSYMISNASATLPTIIATQQGTLSATTGTVTALWLGENPAAGQHQYLDDATSLTAITTPGSATNWTWNGTNWLPFFVLPPNWAVLFQCSAAATGMRVSFMWEELDAADPRLSWGGQRI
jgi:hypothetical protein